MTMLIQMYVVGVFISFTLSQTGMVRHWTRHLRTEDDPPSGRRCADRGWSTRLGW